MRADRSASLSKTWLQSPETALENSVCRSGFIFKISQRWLGDGGGKKLAVDRVSGAAIDWKTENAIEASLLVGH